MERIIAAGSPQRLVEEAKKTLAARLGEYFDALLSRAALPVGQLQPFSGRAVISPGVGLRPDQVGLPDALFTTLVEPRSQDTEWVLINRAPTLAPTNLIAFTRCACPAAPFACTRWPAKRSTLISTATRWLCSCPSARRHSVKRASGCRWRAICAATRPSSTKMDC